MRQHGWISLGCAGCEVLICSRDRTCNGPGPVTGHGHATVDMEQTNQGVCVPLVAMPSPNDICRPISITGDAWGWWVGCVCLC